MDIAMFYFMNQPLTLALLMLPGFRMLRCMPGRGMPSHCSFSIIWPVLDLPSFLTPSQIRAARPGGV